MARPEGLVAGVDSWIAMEQANRRRNGLRALSILQMGLVGGNEYRVDPNFPLPYGHNPNSYISTQEGGVLSLFEQRLWQPGPRFEPSGKAGLIIVVQATGDDPQLIKAMRESRFIGQARAVVIYTGGQDVELGDADNLSYKVKRPMTYSSGNPARRVIAGGPSRLSRVSPKLVEVLLDRVERSDDFRRAVVKNQSSGLPQSTVTA